MRELIKVWNSKPFSLRIYDIGKYESSAFGRIYLEYVFRCEGKIVFQGKDFSPGASTAIDSMECVASLLSFISLRPGDTDREYFDSYTPEQMAFAREHGETLGYMASMMEERAAKKRR